ncbi:hypothetical protein IQ13_4145 [Lacibacter cauensis]|uniref:Uncharacterized protein n=1 Tax=Lacibacter cauensis TaxID=510947 RepID=A0A562S915_9BACT|nr:hypothetical protein [Lacibacter cauensis]TWI77905.1 hypothetical protein IQ13_4145 [Lacibacter cauensis]
MVQTLVMTGSLQVLAQYAKTDSSYKWCFVGSTLFLLGNLSSVNHPGFVPVNIGYRIRGKVALTVEPKIWKYDWPNSIHPFFKKAYINLEEQFPGYVPAVGLSVPYQRFLHKDHCAEMNPIHTLQKFVHDEGKNIDNDFQLFNTCRVGYDMKLFKHRFFSTIPGPTTAYLSTKLADGFKQLDDKRAKWFLENR